MEEVNGISKTEEEAVVSEQANGESEKELARDMSELSVTAKSPPTKYRHDWYQTETDVCINILIKKLKKENVHVNFKEKSVSVHIEVGESDIYSLELTLSNPVNVSKCVTKVLGSKVELRMRKCEGIQWNSLEAKEDAKKLKLPKDVSTGKTGKEQEINKYPSSSHYTRDWDKLVAEVKEEEKNEKPEGDAALNSLFQKIYSDGSDEVKKAMNKSFMESGGTVLSTNWGEIGKEKVERKPPDGMEWKEYEK